jgi:hypothetical protein
MTVALLRLASAATVPRSSSMHVCRVAIWAFSLAGIVSELVGCIGIRGAQFKFSFSC